MSMGGWLDRFRGISMKLALWTCGLISLLTLGSSLVMLDVMEETLLAELVRRGAAISASIASPAAFSILEGDRLALDNLAAKTIEAQDDLVYLAIVDTRGKILAHSRLEATGGDFLPATGELLPQSGGSTVSRLSGEAAAFEFHTPVLFSGKRIGEIYLGIGDQVLQGSRAEARGKVALVAAGVLGAGLIGTLLLATLLTRPIKRLSLGVAALQAGECVRVPVTSGDELGRLTREFNTMATELGRQKARLAEHAQQLEEAYVATVRLLAAAMDARDEYTLGHSTRVATLSSLVGRRLNLSAAAQRDLTVACFLHDVGKIRIPDRILHKRGSLSSVEHACILKHPEHGADILRLVDSLCHYVPAVLHHHERWDGRGYPAGLQGEEIPLFAAILAITDAYDAMTSSRPYRVGLSREQAIKELQRGSGSQFSPYLVEVFLLALEEYGDESAPAFFAG
ncbi:MAG: HD domain-containing protein, partial [Desulfuromonadales bacterium]|nr:HD domain-containing protein [Desulfuromonadales bacterium]